MVAGSVFSHARLFTGAPKARVFAFNERRAFQRGRERGVHGASVRGSGRAIMAEVATKKSINVVSSKKSEVCSVQSNNGLIELDNLTAGNKQLISLCDTNDDEDDLILTNNTRNELDSDDKSLQELIESELALRICSNNEPQASIHDADMEQVEEEGEEEEEDTTNEPETVKRILLDRQQDIVDANSEFIAAESEHSALIEKSYNYQNGHVSPDTKICYEEEVKPEPIMVAIRDEQEQEVEEEQVFDEQPEVGSTIVVQETTTIEMDRSAARDSSDDDKPFRQNEDNEDNEDPSPSYPVCRPAEVEDRPPEVSSMIVESFEPSCENEQEDRVTTMPVVYGDKYQEEREVEDTVLEEHLDQTEAGATTESDPMKIEQLDNWTEQSAFVENQQTGQFSDNFDQTLCQEGIELCSTDQQLVKESSLRENSKLEASLRSKCNKEDLKEESKVSKTEEKIPSNVAEEPEEPEEEAPGSPVQSRSFDDGAMSRSESSADAISTQEFIDTERRVLSEENEDQQIVQEEVQPPSTEKIEPPIEEEEEVEGKEEINDNTDEQNAIAESSSELSVSEPTFIEKTEVVISESNVTIFSETRCLETENESEALIEEQIQSEQQLDSGSSLRAPLATPDDEISDVSNACDSESREETITTSTTVTSPGTKVGTKTKKKKIEGVAGNDASPNLTPRTKKTKKSKKSELEKENISVNCNMQESSMHPGSRQMHPETLDFSDEDDLSNVNVKSLTQTYVSETSRNEQDRCSKEKIATGVSIKQLVGQNGDTNANCRSCGKVVFQMEQTKAEGLVWHKNCFRCVQCSKQLNVDNYESHESTLYCKPHFKELFQPKPVEESEQPVRPRKPELIIRENEPKELPPDVVRASDKPDLGLEELSSLNVKSRFQVFEKAGTETNEIERSPSQIAVKRSPSILSKLAKFQAKGMDIGVADESLNGIPYEESSESEEEEETEETEEVDSEIVKAKRTTRERPISFTKMDDIKNRWETTSQQGRKEVQREARKEEIAGIRSRLFMGKQGKMKEMYQQAVAGSERVTKINAAEELQHSSTHARSIKERFERGEPIATSDDETDGKPKPEKADEEVIAAGISRKSRSMFLELDASAAKTGRPVTPVNPKTPAEAPRRARDAFMGRQVSDDVVRSSDTTEEVHAETSDISNKFKFFESYKEPEKQRKQFRITPPRDGQLKMDSPEREIYRDPDVVRAEDRVDEVVHTDTARKMLSIFRQMEENACKQELPNGPKPLKRFTPPPEDKYAKPTASDSEEEEEEEGEESDGEDSGGEERDPNYVRASDKVEDEFLKQAQNAARAKTLCAKFEHWEETDAKTTMSSSQNIAEMEIAQNTGDQSSIESASSLRARFESLGSQTSESPRTPKVKVNRFVEIQASCTDVCESCEKKVYPLEKVETNNKIFHKQCFRCLQCNCVLRMDTFTLNNGKLYCIPHFKQLFITRGNYDEGFGVDPHKNKWSSSSSNPTSPSPIAVSNGDL
ncbi:xin actin-binding repeat-containing protein 2 isoform X11 [Osmia bicornis bicornis]|uniref:xin actin-binding repeat-containing protein 2 isoform X11 n=1 Tax=Osmia bicornis bicornis TaxID=1437191 RepID=UPI001EAF6622|nr:xin actin-binding repeat-containing protein 2 isoform X11 [Osmia bicornis bicornis]